MRLEGLLAGLARADPVGLLDGQDEDLPVTDVAGTGVPQDRVDDRRHVLRGDHALDLELRPQVVRQRRAAIALGDALLPAGALHLRERERGEPALEQLLANRLERLVSDVRHDHLHAVTSRVSGAGGGATTWPPVGPE